MTDENFMLVSLKDSKLKKIAEVLSSETSKKIISYLTTVKEANAKEYCRLQLKKTS